LRVVDDLLAPILGSRPRPGRGGGLASADERHLLHELLEQSHEFVGIVDVSGRLVYANERLRRFFGLEAGGDFRLEHAAAHFGEASLAVLRDEAIPQLYRTGSWKGELELIGRDGMRITVFETTRLHRDAAGEPTYVSSIAQDITELRAARHRLEASEARFRSLAQHSNDLLAIVDMSGRYVYVSPSHERVLGYSPDELVGQQPLVLIHPEDRDRAREAFAAQILGDPDREPQPVEFRHLHRDGSFRHMEAIATNRITDPAIAGVVVNARDVTERRRAADLSAVQANILERAARHQPLPDALPHVAVMLERSIDGDVAIILFHEDRPGVEIAVAPRLPSTCAAALAGIRGTIGALDAWAELHEEDGYLQGRMVDSAVPHQTAVEFLAAGYSHWTNAVIRDGGVGTPLGVVIVLGHQELRPQDGELIRKAADLVALCVERTRSAGRMKRLALHDALTGLPNRARVTEHLDRLAIAADPSTPAAVLFLDLDRLKVVNDSMGHAAGDRILVELGRRLRAEVRPSDLVARFAGDEFVIVAERQSRAGARELAARVLEVVGRPYLIDGRELVVTGSIGVAFLDGRDAEAVLRDADAAMYAAKAGGRARVEVFTSDLHVRATERLELEADLRRALAQDEFTMYFQPAVALEDDTLLGLGSHLRWEHPVRGLVVPEEFGEVAEEIGVIGALDRFALEAACEQGASWRARRCFGDFALGVHVCGSTFGSPDFPEDLDAILDRTGMPPEYLVIELSERTLIDIAPRLTSAMDELRARGVGVVLQDFGTGYSSLAHLRRYRIQTLKLHSSIVQRMVSSPDDRAMVAAVVTLGRQLGLYTLATGVETREQAAALRALGCDMGQGDLWCPPLPVDELEAALGARSGDRTLASLSSRPVVFDHTQ
jgi:diguanylate cyclase (GGDEF)-like protein/PAS domain S-box-containing protein